ncbi:F-box only protein 32-like [Mya arenaria]|uniref:F-box only protein 32-like n=1 Tax=Mya arenaria TaxID=6604 RepID=UPI0022E54455|nr:F-box only protein 32-like [Mya arenaria]
MPFLGKDWRGSGDEWVRTKEGSWEKLKIWRVKVFENLNSQYIARLLRLALVEWNGYYDDLQNVHRPSIRYQRAISREQMTLTTISEAFVHLDMATAGRDLKRFNYVCKLLRLLLCEKLAFLSGHAQKHMFAILEEMVNDVLRSQNNVGEMRKLVYCAVRALHEHRCDHIGCSALWNEHLKAANRMADKLRRFRVKERKSDGCMTFNNLPPECKQQIMLKIPDHSDLLRLGQTDTHNNAITDDTLLWKQLVLFHFTSRQILTFLNKNEQESDIDWKYIYKRCYLRFGKKEVYSDVLAICRHCNHIFWQSLGHPCASEHQPKSRSLKPEEFLALFQF